MLRSCNLSDEESREAAGYVFRRTKTGKSFFQAARLTCASQTGFPSEKESPSQLEEIANLMEHNQYKYPITMRYRAQEGECMLEPDLFKSLMMNLIDNAIKSMDERGGVVSVHIEMLGDGCKCIIRDTGRGIPQEEITRITEAFYRVDKSRSRRQGGVGLGLALCHEIVRLHKGTMEFASEPDKGTTVTIVLRGGAI